MDSKQAKGKNRGYTMRPAVMSVTLVLFVAMLIAVAVNAKQFYHVLNELIMNNAMWHFGWCLSLICLAMVVFCIVAMVTPIGNIRLGEPNTKPKFSHM